MQRNGVKSNSTTSLRHSNELPDILTTSKRRYEMPKKMINCHMGNCDVWKPISYVDRLKSETPSNLDDVKEDDKHNTESPYAVISVAHVKGKHIEGKEKFKKNHVNRLAYPIFENHHVYENFDSQEGGIYQNIMFSNGKSSVTTNSSNQLVSFLPTHEPSLDSSHNNPQNQLENEPTIVVPQNNRSNAMEKFVHQTILRVTIYHTRFHF